MTSQTRTSEDGALPERWRKCVHAACTALDVRPYPDSVAACSDLAFALVRKGLDKQLLLISEDVSRIAQFEGTPCDVPRSQVLARVALCPLTPGNAEALRRSVPFLAPIVPRQGPSIGTGDRLGVATPGHIRAVRGRGIQPVLAQQSIREMSRTGRAPHEVLDDATWGVLQTGYREGYGADADHLKTVADVALTLDAGFTMYTVDPGDHVDDSADRLEIDDLAARIPTLPWTELHCTPDDCRRRYVDKTVTVAGRRGKIRLRLTPHAVWRAVVKYGPAIAHTVSLYRYLVSRCPRERFAFEVSVDETSTPTSAVEHFYIASELKRLGVQWDSLAPRFVGSFYKGVDYAGDLERFRTEFGKHVLIAQHFGAYQLSLHSGSDKFTIYPVIAELAGDLIHVKTSGTSYLEALRVVAAAEPDLFRRILALAKQRYAEDAASYYVSADLAKVAEVDTVRDEDLPAMLDQPDTRQVCHVTFGSVLTAKGEDGSPLFRDRLLSLLKRNEEAYYHRLAEHFDRHISPFV